MSKKLDHNKIITTIEKNGFTIIDYNFKNLKSKIQVQCKTCNKIFLKFGTEMYYNRSGCPYCKGGVKKNLKYYLAKSRKAHGSQYEYLLDGFVYTNCYSKIKIRCKKCNSIFEQQLLVHANGHGCPYCNGGVKRDLKYFLDKAKIIHKDKYDYNLVQYKHSKSKVKIQCKKCNSIFEQNPNNHLQGQGCPYCSKKHQRQIYDFIKSITNENVIFDDRQTLEGCELDIYIPDKRLAIEYNGLMYHSFGISKYKVFNNFESENLKKWSHFNKMQLCKKNNITLLQFFEDELVNDVKFNIMKDIIKSKLNLNSRIYARKCEINIVSKEQANNFLTLNHMQGKSISKICIGLFYNNELVSLMTFGPSRFNNKYEYELLRFCCKQNYNVVGGASKLFAFFTRNYKPKNIVSYANLRWSYGDLYYKLGFNYKGVTDLNYFYFIPGHYTLYSRQQFQKHKLSKKLKYFDANLTELQNMYLNNYRKIYDAGNMIFEWNLKERKYA